MIKHKIRYRSKIHHKSPKYRNTRKWHNWYSDLTNWRRSQSFKISIHVKYFTNQDTLVSLTISNHDEYPQIINIAYNKGIVRYQQGRCLNRYYR